MINRIRDIRRQKGLTLADVAARCSPPTTAQTIGRLETGMRSLSLDWMNRIAAALDVPSATLVQADEPGRAPQVIARLADGQPHSLPNPVDAILPIGNAGTPLLAMAVDSSAGDYRAGDQVWLRRLDPADFNRAMHRDVLAACPQGNLAFGRLIALEGGNAVLLPPMPGRRPSTVAAPAWLAVAETLVRRL